MPFHQNFEELYAKGEMHVKPNGWAELDIDYGYTDIGRQKNFCWRIKGTQHTFRIPLTSLNEFSQGNYEHHIEYVLENFRQEYFSWAAQGFPAKWMVEYHREYSNYIQI